MTLFIRADNPDVLIEIGADNQIVASKLWQAGRELSVQINQVIEDLLLLADAKLPDVTGIVVYQGPGSYTGLRISVSVANALGYSLAIPVVATSGENWKDAGSTKLKTADNFAPVAPVYGGQVYTTTPRK